MRLTRTSASLLGWSSAVLAAAALSATAVGAACAGPKAARGPAAAAAQHPEVDADIETCAGCHEQATPEVFAQWNRGRHGLALVECFVCHGSTGADFRPRPDVAGCRSCHPRQVASVTRGGATRKCFECHSAHALRAEGQASPHGAAVSGGQP